jgi:hypothetical protein
VILTEEVQVVVWWWKKFSKKRRKLHQEEKVQVALDLTEALRALEEEVLLHVKVALEEDSE